MAQNIERELQKEISKLPTEQQRRVLDFARSLMTTERDGPLGPAMLRFAGAIEPSDLWIMDKAISDGCEKVNPDEW